MLESLLDPRKFHSYDFLHIFYSRGLQQLVFKNKPLKNNCSTCLFNTKHVKIKLNFFNEKCYWGIGLLILVIIIDGIFYKTYEKVLLSNKKKQKKTQVN